MAKKKQDAATPPQDPTTPAAAPTDTAAPEAEKKTVRKRTIRKAIPDVTDLPAAEAPLLRYEAFATAKIDRHLIKNADYNPRTIDHDARQRLEDELKRGSVQPPVWNKRTGNLVGGHQRLSRFDDLMQGKPYSLTLAVVDVDETEEKRLNIALNNPDMMGQYDYTRLEDVLRDIREANPLVDLPAETGFSEATLEVYHIDPALFLVPETSADVRAVLEDSEEILKLKDQKKQHKKDSRLAATRDALRQLVIVLPDVDKLAELRAQILGKLGLPADYDSPYVDAWRLCKQLDIEIDQEDTDEGEAA